MVDRNLNSAAISDMSNRVQAYEVVAMQTDGVRDQEETRYSITKWSQWFGYYKQIPELKKSIDMMAVWTVGKGFRADDETTVILENIKGCGFDTFNSILKNMIIVSQICGDAFAEIVRDEDTGELLNIKPLDPGSIEIVFDRKGMIKAYEQINKVKGGSPKKFKPSEIFHLTKDRVGDEIHGVGIVESVEKIILMRNESMDIMYKVMRRHAKPLMKFILDTDDTGKIDAFIRKYDDAVNKGENIYVPKGTVEHELISVPTNAVLNPLPWIEDLKNFFYQAVGIPQIILGGSQEFTEATAKIAYLAFQQSVEDFQMIIESQVWEQLQLKIELDFPASLENELLSSEQKNTGQTGFQPSETTATINEE